MNTAVVENALAETSTVQGLKLMVLQYSGLTHESFHFLLGLVVHLAACVLWRRPLSWWGGLVAVLVVALLLEVMDLRDDWNSLGFMRFGESSKDVIHSLVPSLMIIAAQLLVARRGRRDRLPPEGASAAEARGDPA